MTPARKATSRKTSESRVAAVVEGPLRLDYALSELPSAQHRAGLAGLVLMIQALERGQRKQPGICKTTALTEHGASFELDLAGLKRLFDELYAASLEEQSENQVRKDRHGQEVPPLRVEEREVKDEKGKAKKKKSFIYEVPVPTAGLIQAMAPGGGEAWVKLWRDMVWRTLRGVPATREPFAARAEKRPTHDAEETWKDLTQRKAGSVALSSTDFLGAMAKTSENVPFSDRPRFQFLLNFWPYVAQVYVPQVVMIEGHRTRRESKGYALAVPDVSRLESFCALLPDALQSRNHEMLGFRPKEALIDLAIESALLTGKRLKDRLEQREGANTTSGLVLGYDVFHLDKEGNNIRLYLVTRIEPTPVMLDRYEALRRSLWDPLFRQARLQNLLADRRWYAGFDRLAETLPYELTVGSNTFRHDAKTSFENEGEDSMEKQEQPASGEPVEQLVYQLVKQYVHRKLKSKKGLSWENVEAEPGRKDEYNKEKERIAKDAFLAVRSRTGADFVGYFAGTLCSVPHYLKVEDFVRLSKALNERTDEIRTLTLLALSANS